MWKQHLVTGPVIPENRLLTEREIKRETDRKKPKQIENFREQSTIIPTVKLGKYAKLYWGHQLTTL